MDFERVAHAISDWMSAQVRQAGRKGIVVGLSGGVDSAVVAALARTAVGDAVLGVLMPCESLAQDTDDARLIADALHVETTTVALEAAYCALLQALPPNGSDLARANLKPRLRMAALYFVANARDYMVAGTGNRSELSVGYFTKYGDGGVDMLPIGGLLKWQVRGLARHLGVPDRIIEKPPTAGLWAGQTDEGEMGITYKALDGILQALEEGRTPDAPAEQVARVQSLMRASEHKRALAPICMTWRKG